MSQSSTPHASPTGEGRQPRGQLPPDRTPPQVPPGTTPRPDVEDPPAQPQPGEIRDPGKEKPKQLEP